MQEKLASFGFGTKLERELVKRSFAIDSYQPRDPTYFGNTMLVLSNDQARLRFIRDRGDDFVDFAPVGSEEWFGLRPIIKLVAPTLLFEGQVRLRLGLEEAVAQLLDVHWDRIAELLAESNLAGTRAAIRTLQETEVASFLERRRGSIKR
jgi:hypothetical protein